MSSTTTHYALIKPAVNSAVDQDLWGGELNDDLDSIDSLIYTATNWIKRVVTGTDTATTADQNKFILGNATSASYVQTLPSAAAAGDGFAIGFVKIDSTAHTITLTRVGSDHIGPDTTFTLSNQDDSVILVSDGIDAWNFLSKAPSVPDSTTSVKGITKYATDAEAIAKVVTTAALTPSNLASVFDVSTIGSGYVTIGGMIFQWGNTGTYNENVSTAITFPLTFPTACLEVVGVSNTHITASSAATAVTAFTASGFTMYTGGGGGGQLRGLRWLAIGY